MFRLFAAARNESLAAIVRFCNRPREIARLCLNDALLFALR